MYADALIYSLIFLLASSKYDEMDEAALAKKIKNGDHDAFKTFFETYHQPLYHYLTGKGIAKEAAEDLIQKAFVYIWEHRQNIHPEKSLRAYLFRIGYTRMLNHIRDAKKFDSNIKFDSFESGSTPEQELYGQELHTAIEKTIRAMPEKRGLVFEMCFIREFTYRETAEALNVSPKTVENHMGLALKDIRAALKNFYPDK